MNLFSLFICHQTQTNGTGTKREDLGQPLICLFSLVCQGKKYGTDHKLPILISNFAISLSNLKRKV